jgi:hypothetical protein
MERTAYRGRVTFQNFKPQLTRAEVTNLRDFQGCQEGINSTMKALAKSPTAALSP